MNLPELPNLTPAIVYQPWEVDKLVRMYGEACFRAGMERAAVICDGIAETRMRSDLSYTAAQRAAAAIRGEAERKDER